MNNLMNLKAVAQYQVTPVDIDDLASNDLPWHEVRKAREQELKGSRDLGVCAKIEENEAVAQYIISPVDTK